MTRNRNDVDPWEFRIVLGTRLRKALIIGVSIVVAWTTFQIALQLIYVAR